MTVLPVTQIRLLDTPSRIRFRRLRAAQGRGCEMQVGIQGPLVGADHVERLRRENTGVRGGGLLPVSPGSIALSLLPRWLRGKW